MRFKKTVWAYWLLLESAWAAHIPNMASLRRSPLRCQLRSRNYFTVFAWYTAIRYFIFISYRKPCAIAADTVFFAAPRAVGSLSFPAQGHITRRSIFTFLGLRARTLHFGAERYSDSCCLYGVCGLKSFCFFCSKSVASLCSV